MKANVQIKSICFNKIVGPSSKHVINIRQINIFLFFRFFFLSTLTVRHKREEEISVLSSQAREYSSHVISTVHEIFTLKIQVCYFGFFLHIPLILLTLLNASHYNLYVLYLFLSTLIKLQSAFKLHSDKNLNLRICKLSNRQENSRCKRHWQKQTLYVLNDVRLKIVRKTYKKNFIAKLHTYIYIYIYKITHLEIYTGRVHLPGKPRFLLQGLDHFDDVHGVPGAATLRHPLATSFAQLAALAAGRGRDLPFCVHRCLTTPRQESRNALDERRAGTKTHAGGTLSAGAHAGAWTILLRLHHRRSNAPSSGHPSLW